jgi:hypothetical protein
VAPRNDIVFVFTDGEEAGLLGAEAFAAEHPLAARGGVVLNVEARGTGGPVIMFETANGNASLVDVFAGAAHPVGTSFAVEIYRILPNDTDFSVFLRIRPGAPGAGPADVRAGHRDGQGALGQPGVHTRGVAPPVRVGAGGHHHRLPGPA